MNIDWWTVAATIVNFFILFFILKHFLFKPVSDMITSRQNEIDTTINDANESKAKAELYKTETETNLKESRTKGKAIVEDYKKKAEVLYDELKNDANKEAQEIIERAMREAEREKQKAESEIKHQVVDLAVMLSSKALEKSINEEEHRRLINEFIAKVGI